MAADEQMGDLNTVAPLIKTVEFPGFLSPAISCNDLFFGCYMVNMEEEQFVVLFEKTALLDRATLPGQTGRNRIPLQRRVTSAMNDTSLIFIQQPPETENQAKNYSCKKDFWMSNTIP